MKNLEYISYRTNWYAHLFPNEYFYQVLAEAFWEKMPCNHNKCLNVPNGSLKGKNISCSSSMRRISGLLKYLASGWACPPGDGSLFHLCAYLCWQAWREEYICPSAPWMERITKSWPGRQRWAEPAEMSDFLQHQLQRRKGKKNKKQKMWCICLHHPSKMP